MPCISSMSYHLCLPNIISSSQKFLNVFSTLVTENFLRKREQTVSSFLRYLKSFMISGNSTWHDPWCQHRIWPNTVLQFSMTAFEAIAVNRRVLMQTFCSVKMLGMMILFLKWVFRMLIELKPCVCFVKQTKLLPLTKKTAKNRRNVCSAFVPENILHE